MSSAVPAPRRRRRPVVTFVIVSSATAVFAGLTALASGFGYRLGLWSLGIAFQMLAAAAAVGALSGFVAIVGGFWAWRVGARRGAVIALVGLAAGGLTIGVPLGKALAARGLPLIHDISTDTAHPPQFVALRAAREAAPNGAGYGGAALAALQHRYYPGIRPLDYPARPAVAFRRCLAAARALGWKIAAAEPRALRIEATATTLFYGFKDDVVVRITPHGGGSRIDVRSDSRVGRGDFGVNARRIRAFFRELERRG